ncbi:MAG: CehA/McbA family metallohydrolase [Gammaproteobacteria bacterium]|nr:CehA/McbA family metallohydrolase [Gammaproteobacteria bacterium]
MRLVITILLTLLLAVPAIAEREPVLKQIRVPHNYYFREMYLPQVSSGPQSPAWSPDGQSLVYAMQGSLWQQSPDSDVAVQLTAGPGYDHQPDWSPDGRSIVFTRYVADAMELQLLDVASGEVRALTSGGDVNLEPRWSPDGSQLAFVSTTGTGRFHVFVGRFNGDRLQAEPLLAERQSSVERYYYSSFDHEISPSWSADGRELLLVTNPETPYGSGEIWRYRVDGSAPPALVQKEETSWRARPHTAPDGQRVVYASYLGRQWHQLWVKSIAGRGEPFPLTYGDYDASAPRWSPDGKRIAYVVNEFGNTSLRTLELIGGKQTDLNITTRRYLQPGGTLRLVVRNGDGSDASYRASVLGADGRAYAPHDRWLHADDQFDRTQRKEEARYFHATGEVQIELPAGDASIIVWRGMEAAIERHNVEIEAEDTADLELAMQSLELPSTWSEWYSGDVHVHMNYGGNYRNTPANLVAQAEAEDLDMVFNLVVNKEQRVPDIEYFSAEADAASNRQVVVQHSQEFHTSYWGHLGLLGLGEHLLMPDYSAYPYTAAASIYPDNALVADMAREQGAIVGYVHPFDPPPPDPATDARLTNALPIDAALGKIDYYEVLGFADHRTSAEVWYRLLNCGFRISAAGGTDAMANYASLRGPVGMNRTYVRVRNWPDEADARRDKWIQRLKDGKSFATNGPLIGLTVNGEGPGAVLEFDAPPRIDYGGFLRSIVAIDELEIVFNGKVIRRIELDRESTSATFSGEMGIAESGWLVLRASGRGPRREILDQYPYATTSPIYINIAGKSPRSAADAEYFLAWIARVRDAAVAHDSYNSADEKQQVLQNIDAAVTVFEKMR